MKGNLTYGEELFIVKKQNLIRENMLKKKEIQKQINTLLGEIKFLDYDIDSDRYSIRKLKGRA